MSHVSNFKISTSHIKKGKTKPQKTETDETTSNHIFYLAIH